MAVDGNDKVSDQPIQVTTEELLMLLGRLYLENYTLQKRLVGLMRPQATPEGTTEHQEAPTPPTEP